MQKVILSPGIILETTADAFCLYFNKFIFDVIVKYTNIEAINHFSIWRILDVVKLKAFFGLLLTDGHLKQNNINIRTLWNKIYGQPIFCTTMGITGSNKYFGLFILMIKQLVHFAGLKINLLQFAIFLRNAIKIFGNFTFLDVRSYENFFFIFQIRFHYLNNIFNNTTIINIIKTIMYIFNPIVKIQFS